MKKENILSIPIILSLIIIPTNVYAEHIFEDVHAFAQYMDIAQLSSEKFVLMVDGNSYDMYYGYHGSLDSILDEDEQPELLSMMINEERKSLEITFDKVQSDSVFWVRMPENVISAENEHFQLYIDGIETQYDLTKFPNDYAIGMIIPQGGEHVEIVGTGVIPEFSEFLILTLVVGIIPILIITKKFSYNMKF